MKQDVIMFTFQTDSLGELNQRIRERIAILNKKEWRVVNISSCNSTVVTNGGEPLNQVTVFLLVEEI